MDFINKFEIYLDKEKRISKSTLDAYMSDIQEFESFLKKEGVLIEKAKSQNIADFVESLKKNGRSAATVNRKLASVKSFYTFMKRDGRINSNPAAEIKSGKVERADVEFLSEEEINSILDLPDDSVSGLRDRALLETMYATGLRASEICEAKISDLNMKIGYINVQTTGKPRAIPVGKKAREAINTYIKEARKTLLAEKEDEGYLFLSYLGEKLTRQGIWKILKMYGQKAKLGKTLSPQIIRNTFAAHLIQNGADLKSLQELLGHEDITATKIYLKLTKNRIMDVYFKAFPRA